MDSNASDTLDGRVAGWPDAVILVMDPDTDKRASGSRPSRSTPMSWMVGWPVSFLELDSDALDERVDGYRDPRDDFYFPGWTGCRADGFRNPREWTSMPWMDGRTGIALCDGLRCPGWSGGRVSLVMDLMPWMDGLPGQ